MLLKQNIVSDKGGGGIKEFAKVLDVLRWDRCTQKNSTLGAEIFLEKTGRNGLVLGKGYWNSDVGRPARIGDWSTAFPDIYRRLAGESKVRNWTFRR